MPNGTRALKYHTRLGSSDNRPFDVQVSCRLVSPGCSLKHVDGHDLQRVCGVSVVHQDTELEVVMGIASDAQNT